MLDATVIITLVFMLLYVLAVIGWAHDKLKKESDKTKKTQE